MRVCDALLVLAVVDFAASQFAWFEDNNDGAACQSPRGVSGVCRRRDDCLVKLPNPRPVSEDETGRALCGSLGPGALVCCETGPISDVVTTTEASPPPATTEPPRPPVGERSTGYCLENITFRRQPWWVNEDYRLEKKEIVPWWKEEKKERLWVPQKSLNEINRGAQTYHREFPHIALLGYLGPGAAEVTWHCSGSLISERFVLTAGHCFADSRLGAPVVVRLGERDLSRKEGTEKDYSIERTWLHPLEQPGTWYHDLALIKLSRVVKFTRAVSPACLSIRPEGEQGEEGLVVAGWGSSARGDTPSQVLLKGSGPMSVIPRNECARYYRLSTNLLPNGIYPGLLCAADLVGDVNTCQGDSGGPLQLKTAFDVYVIVGVTTAGVRFCGERTPNVYTRVSFYLDWIENIVWPDRDV